MAKVGRPKKSIDVIITCPMCGKQHTCRPYDVHKFCSLKCYHKSVANRVEKVCPVCGKTFSVWACNANRYTTCSQECACKFPSALRRYPAHIKVCENCGTEFRHTPSTNPRFCCFACYRQAIAKRDGETSIEKKVRLFLQTLNIPFEQEYKLARYSLDFFIPLLNLVIECDGTYWHKDAKRDRAKNQYLKRHGFKLLRLSEDDINSSKSNNQIELHILNKSLKLI